MSNFWISYYRWKNAMFLGEIPYFDIFEGLKEEVELEQRLQMGL